MKKPIYILFAIGAFTFTSCGGSTTTTGEKGDKTEQLAEEPEKEPITIVGAWKMSDVDLGMEIPKGREKMFAELKENMVANSSISFASDGTYSDVQAMGKDIIKSNGTYTADDEALTTVCKGTTSKMKIGELTESTLVLEIEERGSTMKMTYSRK